MGGVDLKGPRVRDHIANLGPRCRPIGHKDFFHFVSMCEQSDQHKRGDLRMHELLDNSSVGVNCVVVPCENVNASCIRTGFLDIGVEDLSSCLAKLLAQDREHMSAGHKNK